jgi:hypothetical protein
MNRTDVAMGESYGDDVDAPPLQQAYESEEQLDPELYAHEWLQKLNQRSESDHGPPTSRARYLLFVLIRHADAEGRTMMPLEALAKRTAIRQMRTLRNTLQKLEKDGWIKLEPMGEIRILQTNLAK